MDAQPYSRSAPPPPGRRDSHRRLAVLGVSTAAIAATVLVLTVADGGVQLVNGSGTTAQALPAIDRVPGSASPSPAPGAGAKGSGGSGATTPARSSTSASTAQQVGVVDIDTVLAYQQAQAAGTGMVLTSAGDVLTNNHVVDGATRISVTVVSTGRTYRASVVGTDPTQDIAVLRLQNASGLQRANFGTASGVRVGDRVTGVGNGGGAGGTPNAASGIVEALGQPITAADQSGTNAERLTDMIKTSDPIVPGDSGGPLYDSAGSVVGTDTAANASVASTGYAITIDRALAIAAQIESGRQSSTVHLGYPGFLGVSVVDANGGGAGIDSVVPGGPADRAGIVAGDVVTAVGATPVTSGANLRDALSGDKPGQAVTITWNDGAGRSRRAGVTLAAGPAD
ncbi:MAG: S1C family serine protease [Jatrophihabitantaceae bacterium]